MQNLVLVLNCGSSSIKFAIVDPSSGNESFSGLVQNINSKDANISWKYNGEKQSKDLPNVNYTDSLNFILLLVQNEETLFTNICAVGHRVVHGGERFSRSVIVNDEVLQAIRDCQGLAPLHNPANIAGIEEARKIFPNLPQVVVFDTAFHQTMPEYAYLYAIPYALYKNHQIRRYGFHGTSHKFVSAQASKILAKPLNECALITAHLGNGCSICAILNGKSIDTSMGLTPLEGLVMGTRSGDIDPSIHGHLVDNFGYDIHKINTLLNKESGLLGISEMSADMRDIEDAVEKGNKQAMLAADIFCYRLAKYIGAYAIALGSLDALVFTGGIGENSPYIRAKTLEWLKILNFHTNKERNDENGKNSNGLITTEGSSKALVIKTNEELVIARDAISLVKEC